MLRHKNIQKQICFNSAKWVVICKRLIMLPYKNYDLVISILDIELIKTFDKNSYVIS